MGRHFAPKYLVVLSAISFWLLPAESITARPIPTAAQSGTAPRFAKGPADGVQVVNSALQTPPFTRDHPLLADFRVLEVLQPMARYILLIPETANDGQLAVQADGWQYLVKSSGVPGKGVAAIAVRADATGRVQMSSFRYENVADPLVRALNRLATLEQIRAGTYEARLLQVFGLVGNNPVEVIWLTSDTGAADLFYEPLSPNPNLSSKLQFEKLYSKEEFLSVAKGAPLGARGRPATPSR